jgi:hypothetical protein
MVPKRDRYGRYLIPPAAGGKPVGHTRATTVAETLDDRYNLEQWKLRTCALGLVERPDLLAQVAAHTADDKGTLNAVCKQAIEAGQGGVAANMGTALHRILERVDTGELAASEVPEQFRPIAEGYVAAMTAHGITVDPEFCERVHVLSALDEPIAGMADNHVLVGGRRYIFDKKTGSGIDYGARGFAVQLSIYAHAETLYDYDTEEHTPAPECDRERAIIAHIPAKGGPVTFHWINIAAGWEALKQSLWARRWRRKKDLLTPFDEFADGDPTGTVEAPAATAGTTRIEPRRKATQRPDEGDPVNPEKVQKLRKAVGLDRDIALTVSAWVKQGTDAGVPWNMPPGGCNTRRYGIAMVAVELAPYGDDVARRLLTEVLGEDRVQPGFPVGAVLGSMSIDEARKAYKAARS